MRKQLIQIPTEDEARFFSLSPSVVVIIFGIFFGVLFAFSFSPYLDMIERLMVKMDHLKKFPQDHDFVLDYSIGLMHAIFLGIFILFIPFKYEDKKMLFWAWIIKCFIALFVMLFYEAYFSSDAIGYWNITLNIRHFLDKGIVESFMADFRYAFRMHLVINAYNSIVPDFIANSYNSLKVTHAMFSLVAVYLFYRAAITITKKESRIFFWILVLWPSLLLYTNRIGKDVLVFFGVAVFITGVVNWHYKRKFIHLCLFMFGVLICTYLRAWMGPILLGPSILYFLVASKDFFSRFIVVLLVAVFFFPFTDFVMGKLGLPSEDREKRIYQRATQMLSYDFGAQVNAYSGSAAEQPDIIIEGPLDVIQYAPRGIFSALFRPLPFDVSGPLGFLAALEGLILLYLLFRVIQRTSVRELKDPILLWAIAIVLSWALIYSVAINNFGTGIRWRTQILPIFMGLLFYLGRYRDRENTRVNPSKP